MPNTTAQNEIETLVYQYARSVTEADTDLTATIWSTTEDVSFIHPKGDERGWEEVKTQVYDKLMRDNFSTRTLQVYDLDVQCYGDMAIAVFYWNFDAVWRDDGTPHHTEGRETQVFRYDGDRWLLMHIHYSNMPVTGEREGF